MWQIILIVPVYEGWYKRQKQNINSNVINTRMEMSGKSFSSIHPVHNCTLNNSLTNPHDIQLLKGVKVTEKYVCSYPERPLFCSLQCLPHSSQGEATTRMCNSPSLCSNQPVRHCGEFIQQDTLTTSVQHNSNGWINRGTFPNPHAVTSKISQTSLLQ